MNSEQRVGDRARLLAGPGPAERRETVAGIRTAIIEIGGGTPLVLLHGGIEVGAAYWAPVLGSLAARHRAIAPDIPGLGESEPFGRLDQSAFDDWLAAFLDQACEGPPSLVAHSLVGSLAARFAAHHPGRLSRLVVYGAPGIGRYRMSLGLRATLIGFAVHPSARSAERIERRAFHDLDAAVGRDPEWMAAFRSELRRRAVVGSVKRTMRQLAGAGTKRIGDDTLSAIEVPTALIWGSDDRFVPLALGERASAALGWPLSVIDEAGHVPHIERPEQFVAALAKLDA